MSYCRWSSDNFYCDAYVYESSAGWETHLANQRRPPGAPDNGATAMFKSLQVLRNDLAADAYRLAQAAWDEWAERNPLQPIDHDEAGESFIHESPGECADNLERLRSEGFVIPQYAIDALREKQSQLTTQEAG